MKKIFFLASIISLACASCKTKKNSASSSENKIDLITNTPSNSLTYRLIVSFISKGSGTDKVRKERFLNYLNSKQVKLDYKTVNWGREGETDYCFMLTELSTKKELFSFIEDIKKISEGSDIMLLTENAECTHKGR